MNFLISCIRSYILTTALSACRDTHAPAINNASSRLENHERPPTHVGNMPAPAALSAKIFRAPVHGMRLHLLPAVSGKAKHCRQMCCNARCKIRRRRSPWFSVGVVGKTGIPNSVGLWKCFRSQCNRELTLVLKNKTPSSLSLPEYRSLS
jgi:hypothetical protein